MAAVRIPIRASTLALIFGVCTAPACTPPTVSEQPLSGQASGCATRLAGPACVPPTDRRLRVWLDTDTPATFEHATVHGTEPRQGGRLHRIEVAPGARWIAARVGPRVWRMPIATELLPEPLRAARAALTARKTAEARALLDGVTTTDPVTRAVEAALRARIDQREGRHAAAAAGFRAAAERAEAAGQISVAGDARIVAAYILIHRLRDFDAARAILAEPVADYPDGEVRRLQLQGHLAEQVGDRRGALVALRAAALGADRMGADALRFYVESSLSLILQALGRTDEAIERLEAIATLAPNPCARAQQLTNVGWIRHLRAEQERAPDPAATEALDAALTLYAGPCKRPGATSARVDRALIALAEGDLIEVRDHLAELGQSTVDPALAPWVAEVKARLALASGDHASAEAAYTTLAAGARAALMPDLAWRAEVGRAQALRSLGRKAAALDALVAAEALLDDQLVGVPIHEGRESFVADREQSARLLVAGLLDAERPTAAFDAARRSRARVLRALQGAESPAYTQAQQTALAEYRAARAELMADAVRDPERSAKALATARAARAAKAIQARALLDAAFGQRRAPPPAAWASARPTLLFHPVPNGWVGLLRDARGVQSRAIDPAAPLAAYTAELEAAGGVDLLTHGPIRALDLHAEPVGGVPLLAHGPVRYVLDLPPPTPGTGTGVLVVADPRGDLPAARTEARTVLDLTRDRAPRHLQGRQATAGAVRSALADAALFHYAGHGVFAGDRGWESVLPLAEGTALGVGDILALPAAPRQVVLSGCETGRTSQSGPGAGLGLGQAFVAAGSSEVLAAVRPVGDALARRIAEAVHRALAGGQPMEAALRTAQLAARDAAPESDWAAFRLLVR